MGIIRSPTSQQHEGLPLYLRPGGGCLRRPPDPRRLDMELLAMVLLDITLLLELVPDRPPTSPSLSLTKESTGLLSSPRPSDPPWLLSLTTPTLPMDAVLPVSSDTDSLDTELLDTELLDTELLDM